MKNISVRTDKKNLVPDSGYAFFNEKILIVPNKQDSCQLKLTQKKESQYQYGECHRLSFFVERAGDFCDLSCNDLIASR